MGLWSVGRVYMGRVYACTYVGMMCVTCVCLSVRVQVCNVHMCMRRAGVRACARMHDHICQHAQRRSYNRSYICAADVTFAPPL